MSLILFRVLQRSISLRTFVYMLALRNSLMNIGPGKFEILRVVVSWEFTKGFC